MLELLAVLAEQTNDEISWPGAVVLVSMFAMFAVIAIAILYFNNKK